MLPVLFYIFNEPRNKESVARHNQFGLLVDLDGTQREFIFGTTKETRAGVDGSARTCIIDESSSDNVIRVALTQLALGSGLVACIHVDNKEFLATEQTSRVFKRFSGQSTFVRKTCVVIIANKYWRKGVQSAIA